MSKTNALVGRLLPALSLLCAARAQDLDAVRTLRVPEQAAVAQIWRDGDLTRYRLSVDGVRFAPPGVARFELLLRHGAFDPLAGVPPTATEFSAKSEHRLAIVQYWTPGLAAYRETVTRLGGEVLLFLGYQADVVELPPTAHDAVRALPFVRALLPYQPAYKVEPELLRETLAGATGKLRVNLLTMRRGPAEKEAVGRFVRERGGVVEHVSPQTWLMSVTIDRDVLPALAARNDVQWLDRWSAPETDMDLARAFHGANYVESQTGYTGQGVRVEVLDGGCDLTHPDMQNFAVHGTNTASDHGTCTSGIVVGTGAGNAAARGVMPSAHLVVGDYEFFSGGSRYAHSQELQNPALALQCVLQSNSWGNARTTAYTSISQDLDAILFDLQRLSILQSQSNAGNQQSRPEAWAKNVISVGGIKHFGTLSKADDSWTLGASIGPAADGRIKPDIASFYDATLCTDMVGAAGYTSTNYYSSFGGTSGATPICAGHLGLFYQLWHNAQFGNAAPGATVFDNRPFNTTAKAMLINTATQWTFSGTTHDLTRTHQGWGHPDTQRMLSLANQMLIVDESDVLGELQSTVHSVTVAAGAPEFRATLVFRDPPGTTASTLHRINNLDLKVTAPDSTVYWGNSGLLAGMWSTPGGAPNTLDTVENVFVQNPIVGNWLVEVIATELNQDAHVETPSVDTDYALVVSGVGNGPPPVPPAAPTALVATSLGTASIGLAWTDNAANETSFRIERSLDGSSFGFLRNVGANVVGDTDSGLSPGTTYFYRVRAENGAGASAWTNLASATTANAVDFIVTAQTAVRGTVTGAFTATQADDGQTQSIREIVASNRSQLEHRWTIGGVPSAGTRTFHLKAYRSASTDGDNFQFACLNGSSWVTLATVSNTSLVGYVTATLPAGVSGNVTIRVIDTNRTRGRTALDTVFVEHMFVRAQ